MAPLAKAGGAFAASYRALAQLQSQIAVLRARWTVRAGVEWFVAQRWTVKTEYLCTDFDSSRTVCRDSS
jgi:opacity protein-like surface antigen